MPIFYSNRILAGFPVSFPHTPDPRLLKSDLARLTAALTLLLGRSACVSPWHAEISRTPQQPCIVADVTGLSAS